MARTFAAYLFRNKDPVMDEVRVMIEDHFGERLCHRHFKLIQEAGGPTATTLRGWYMGKTLRPQNASVEATGRALGRRRTWLVIGRAKLRVVK